MQCSKLLPWLPAGAVAGWALHPLESAAFPRRTQERNVRPPPRLCDNRATHPQLQAARVELSTAHYRFLGRPPLIVAGEQNLLDLRCGGPDYVHASRSVPRDFASGCPRKHRDRMAIHCRVHIHSGVATGRLSPRVRSSLHSIFGKLCPRNRNAGLQREMQNEIGSYQTLNHRCWPQDERESRR